MLLITCFAYFHILYYVYCGGEKMIVNCILLAFSVSVDSLGIGFSYGIKETRINIIAKIVLFSISLLISSLSIKFGNMLISIFSTFFANLIGIIILILMGIWIIFEALNKKTFNYNSNQFKTYNFLIKSLGITVQIIKNPMYSDLDNSNKIDVKEALYLGLALSLDSLCVGLGSSMIKINSYLFPILVSCFQLLFISLGTLMGKKLKSLSNIPNNIWSILSGVLLILIGLIKFL